MRDASAHSSAYTFANHQAHVGSDSRPPTPTVWKPQIWMQTRRLARKNSKLLVVNCSALIGWCPIISGGAQGVSHKYGTPLVLPQDLCGTFSYFLILFSEKY